MVDLLQSVAIIVMAGGMIMHGLAHMGQRK